MKAGRCSCPSVAETGQAPWLTIGVWKKRWGVNWDSCRARRSACSAKWSGVVVGILVRRVI
jgi:hypothetical protein